MKPKSSHRHQGRTRSYRNKDERIYKTFQIRCEKKLSPIAKLVFNSFQDKYLYYAIDDILYSFKSTPNERDYLLEILYCPVISLQNNFFVNFFDIWIDKISIHEISQVNRFLKNDSSNFEQSSDIIMKLSYKTNMPKKKQDSSWY